MDDLDRLFRRLVVNIRADYPAYLTNPFPVAELYQSIVPYRHNRSELEIGVPGDYELALTRLLAGERGYVLGDAAMQHAMRQATETTAFTYRNYAASVIEISADAVRAIDDQMKKQNARTPTPTVSPATRPAAAAPTTILATGPCMFCGGPLPDDRRITFCPHCGHNVTVRLCPACSAELEVEWRFCPVCGREVELEAPEAAVESDAPM